MTSIEIVLVEGDEKKVTRDIIIYNYKLQSSGFVGVNAGPHGRHWWRTHCDGKSIIYTCPDADNVYHQVLKFEFREYTPKSL
jgi:hypothetical protein